MLLPSSPTPPADLTSHALHILARATITGTFLLELRPILRTIAWLAGA